MNIFEAIEALNKGETLYCANTHKWYHVGVSSIFISSKENHSIPCEQRNSKTFTIDEIQSQWDDRVDLEPCFYCDAECYVIGDVQANIECRNCSFQSMAFETPLEAIEKHNQIYNSIYGLGKDGD